MKIRKLVTDLRKELGESQVTFAKRFSTTANTVSRWESGKYQVPNHVVERMLDRKSVEVICSRCMGMGVIEKTNPNHY